MKPNTHRLGRSQERVGLVFGLALLIGCLLFLPFVIWDQGYFIYYGDFNVQQIPFYSMAQEAVRDGNIFWSWTTDLGANFIGSYSFYLLGSPFFWLTLVFPTAVVPYLMAPLMVLKMAFAALAAYGFLRRFVRSDLAVIGGLVYAFSGFSIYNIFFNHFHEALIWLPLMLLAMERFMVDDRRGLFAVTVFFSALNNYYFFIAQALFLMLYWVLRALSGEWKVTFGRFLWLWFEALVGTAMAAVLLLPSFFAVIQNSRTENHLEGWGLLIYDQPQRLFDILHSFFFPQDIPARPNFFPDANNSWSSMSAWLPVFGCTGVLAYCQSRHHTDWLRRGLIILVTCALVPGLNALFQLGNAMYYARWFYILTLLMVLATLKTIDEDREYPVNWKRAVGWVGGIIGATAVLIGLTPTSWTPDEETGKLTFGLYAYIERFWIYIGIAVACLIMTALLASLRRHRTVFFRWSCIAVAAVVLVFGWYHIALGKFQGRFKSSYVRNNAIEAPVFDLPELYDDTVRVDFSNDIDNLGMFWRLPTIQAFHSIVPGSVMEFYTSIGVERNVASRPEMSHYALRSLTSVKWLFDYQNENNSQYKDEESYFAQTADNGNVTLSMPGWSYYDTQHDYAIYRNNNYIPMGFTYTDYLTRSEYDKLSMGTRELVLLKALVIEDDAVDTVAPYLEHLTADRSVYSLTYTRESFAQDCADRNAHTAHAFVRDNHGFTATISLPQDDVVFFSVPYENGWTATVGGQPAEILQANVGFMAVVCPAGEDVVIRFDYMTPGLMMGLWISLGAALLLGIYALVFALRKPPIVETPSPAELPPPAGEFDLYTVFPAEDGDTPPSDGSD